jgi:hypothetical protein
MKAACCYLLNRWHEICESNGDPFPEDVAAECHKTAYEFLQCYSWLARLGEHCEALGEPPCWRIIPKHHYFCHLADDVLRCCTNPSSHHCFLDEDVVGRVARGSRKLHRSTVTGGWLERYVHLLFNRWRVAASF